MLTARTAIAAALGLALCAHVTQQSPVSAQSLPTFRAKTDLVEVSAIVTGADGRSVAGLLADDFEIEEDSKPVPVTAFAVVNTDVARQPAEGRFLVLLLDDTSAALTFRIKQIAHMFSDRMSGNDVVAVLPLNGGKSTTTTCKETVTEEIDRFEVSTMSMRSFGGSGGSGLGRICPECVAMSASASGPSGGGNGRSQSHTIETIADLARKLAKVPHRRKAIVCIGDAGLFDIQMRSTESLRGPIRDLSRADVSLDVIDAVGLRPFEDGGGPGLLADDATGFARETGGRAFVNTNFFERSADELWQQEGHYYLLGYDLPTTAKKGRHSINVRVKRPGVEVRARKSRA